ncbi:MAG TPA: CAP domain-containing protein [Chromatiales bacterium]|nr:CAP domain-containing protein [Chromatiales bacterium]
MMFSKFNRPVAATLLSLTLAACGGGGDDDTTTSSTDSTLVTTIPTGTTTTSTTSSTVDPGVLYVREPNVASCDAGELNPAERDKVLARLNEIRALHGLPAVAYEPNDDVYVTAAALIIAANEQLSHTPATTANCWTNDGYTGSEKSNLHIYMSSSSTTRESSEASVDGFLIDDNVSSLGHRRWLLDPFLFSTAFGRVDGLWPDSTWGNVTGTALKVINDVQANISHMSPTYIAYPVGNYPASLFETDWYLSFSVLADVNNKANNANVDFSGATISVSSGDQALGVNSQSWNNQGYGLPNVLQWKVSGLQTGVDYAVTISNVKLPDGSTKNYSYDFRLE